MGERFRITIILLALGAIALGCYNVANPYRVGQIGFNGATLPNGDNSFDQIYPGASADRAGIRKGDILLVHALSPGQQFGLNMRRGGQRLELPVSRNGKRLTFSIITGTRDNERPVELGPLQLLVLILFAATGTLVALRGSGRVYVKALAWVFIAAAWFQALSWFFNVAPTPGLAFVGAAGIGTEGINSGIASGFVAYVSLIFVGHFPPIKSRVRSFIAKIALPIAAVIVLLSFWADASVWHANWQLFQIAGSPSYTWMSKLLSMVILRLLIIVAAIDGLMHADEAHRIQMRWIGIALILSALPALYPAAYVLTSPATPPFLPWLGLLGDLPLLLIAYAILRHRIVDVTFVVSRAAIFTVLSAVVVAMVVAFEWILSQILARGVGVEAANGFAGQALRLAVAVGVGLVAVPILQLVERWLNRVFFAKRAQALAELNRFALEADVATDSSWLLSVALETVLNSIEGGWVAIYIAEKAVFARVRSSRDNLPRQINENDAAMLRLRRWNQPFEMALGPHPLSEALLVPLSARGELLGTIVCGPKRERTHYLKEEIDALALVGQRVATSYMMLELESRGVAPILAPA